MKQTDQDHHGLCGIRHVPNVMNVMSRQTFFELVGSVPEVAWNLEEDAILRAEPPCLRYSAALFYKDLKLLV